MAMEEPYNRIAKDKVTLSFVGLLYNQKNDERRVLEPN